MTAVVGTPGDDVIVGTAGPDFIDGAGGNDVICGFASSDRLVGGLGDDRLFGGLDADYSCDDGYFGDLLVPGPGDDHVDIGVDPDSLSLCEFDGVETLDRISYADATAGVDANLATGVATGEGRDTLVVGGAFGVLGSPFDDRIIGTEEMNVIEAGAGSDMIRAGGGNDVLELDVDRAVHRPRGRGTPLMRVPDMTTSLSRAATWSPAVLGTMTSTGPAKLAGRSKAAAAGTSSW